MATGSRIRRTIDYGRLREAIAGPGADTRVWSVVGRVDDDPDAIRWESGVGWLVDVTLQGGPLDQEGPVVCRVASPFSGGGVTRSDPPARGCEVQIVLMEGDPNVAPVIVGYTHNNDGCQAPTSVNGEQITEALALVNHILVTPHGVLEQIAGALKQVVDAERHVESTGKHKVLGATLDLAEDGASQSYVRGDEFMAAFTQYIAQLAVWVAATGAAVAPLITPPSASVAYAEATTLIADQTASFLSDLPSYLSQRIKGE